MENNRKKEILRAVKFTLISISAGLIQIGSFELFDKVFHFEYWIAYLPSLLLSVLWNFTINRKYTFKSANNVKVAMLLVLAFYAVFTPVSTVLGNFVENAGANADLVFVVTILCNFVLEFLYTRFIVYRNSCDTAVKTAKGNKKIHGEAAAETAAADGENKADNEGKEE